MAIISFLTLSAEAKERVVVLAPAAADVIFRLGAGDSVVGVTNSVTEFPNATQVGTHLNPGIETVASLKPTLIISSSRFDPEMSSRMGAEHFVYEPKTLDAIIEDIRILAQKLGCEAQGEALALSLEQALLGLTLPENPPTVLYETRSTPLAVAKEHSIMKDILERAGLKYAYPQSSGIISAEYLLANQPDFYLYQVGPMNKNPVPPLERPGWNTLKSCLWKVEELAFARPNTQVFQTVLELNEILNSDSICQTGMKRYF